MGTYQCRDCGEEYEDRIGDHCPQCGGANVIPITDAIGDSRDMLQEVDFRGYDDVEHITFRFDSGQYHIEVRDDGQPIFVEE